MESIWSVILTHHTDDYKSRGDNWTSSTIPKLFKYKGSAEQYLCYALYEIIHEKLTEDYDKSLKELQKDGLNYLIVKNGNDSDDNDEFFIDENHLYDLSLIEKLTTALTKGEYVSQTLTWYIKECELNTNLPIILDSKESQLSDS